MKTSKLFRFMYILIICITSLFNFSFMFQTDGFNFFNERMLLIDSADIPKSLNYIIINYVEGDTVFVLKKLTTDSVLVSFERYNDAMMTTFNGESNYYYPSGKLKCTKQYNNQGELHYYLKSYYPNGKQKRVDLYNNGVLKVGKCFDSLGNKIPYTPYFIDPVVEIEKIQGLIRYPESLRRAGVEENVKVRILFTESGKAILFDYNNLSSFGFIYEIKRLLTEEVSIEPPYQDGEPVMCWVEIPFAFRLK